MNTITQKQWQNYESATEELDQLRSEIQDRFRDWREAATGITDLEDWTETAVQIKEFDLMLKDAVDQYQFDVELHKK